MGHVGHLQGFFESDGFGEVSQILGPEAAIAARRAEARVQDRVAALRGSAFLKRTLEGLGEVWQAASSSQPEDPAASEAAAEPGGRLLCLGIGSVEDSVSSACQLALAWLLAEHLGLQRRIWADPQMHPVDVKAGEALGFAAAAPAAALAEVQAGAEAATGPLLLFMPHCDRALYEQVLTTRLGGAAQARGISASTLTSEREVPMLLQGVVFLGNSFDLYSARDDLGIVPLGTPGAAPTNSLMRWLHPVTREQKLPEFTPAPEAFNDLAIVSFSSEA